MTRKSFAIAALALTCVISRAQETGSHAPLPWGDRTAQEMALQFQRQLMQRNGQPPANLTPEQIRQLKDIFDKTGGNEGRMREELAKQPDLRDAARRSLEGRSPDELKKMLEGMKQPDTPNPGAPGGTSQPGEDFAKWLEGVGKSMPDGPKLPDMPRPNIDPRATGPTPTPINPQEGPKMPDGPTPKMPTPDFKPPDLPNRPLPKLPELRTDRGSGDTGKALERWFPKSMRDSPQMKNFVRDMGKKDWSGLENSRFWKEGKGPNVNWDRVGRGMKGTGNFLNRNLPSVKGRDLPSAPNIHSPNLPSAPNLPSVGGPPSVGGMGGLPEAGGAFTALMIILALAVGGYLLWRLLIRPMQEAKHKVRDHGLGPWPIDPNRVRTRDELVKAFDYLTLLLLGLPAKMWHFRTVAKRLGTDEAKRPAAEELADAYMKARYAPPAEELPEPEMQRARTDLCTLAGVSAP